MSSRNRSNVQSGILKVPLKKIHISLTWKVHILLNESQVALLCQNVLLGLAGEGTPKFSVYTTSLALFGMLGHDLKKWVFH